MKSFGVLALIAAVASAQYSHLSTDPMDRVDALPTSYSVGGPGYGYGSYGGHYSRGSYGYAPKPDLYR